MDNKVIGKIIENTPFAIILVGLFLFLLGAAGQWPTPHIQIHDGAGRISLVVMGAISFLVGVTLLWREKTYKGKKGEATKDYGVKIVSPQEGADIGESFELHGTYHERPPDNLMRVVEFSPISHHYWPKPHLVFNSRQMTWSVTTRAGGNANTKRVFMVMSVGEGGRALFEYYEKVGHEMKQWTGIPTLPADVVEVDRITVKRV